ncbi:hypothetical protein C7271_22195 [filamentous cyanobacterium CCP5]|nr:hypothetical protein C7271_22195 [filamentous cyanobacterium CCP5]
MRRSSREAKTDGKAAVGCRRRRACIGPSGGEINPPPLPLLLPHYLALGGISISLWQLIL